uniref:Uncharacterized protein n=1 Tax=Rhizophora mucronata TaxID=61149 RepID=A0A2P2PBP7_RHIMU
MSLLSPWDFQALIGIPSGSHASVVCFPLIFSYFQRTNTPLVGYLLC